MILRFSDIGVKLHNYNGIQFRTLTPLIINQAADYMLDFGGEYDYEMFNHYNWKVDYIHHKVIIPESAFI